MTTPTSPERRRSSGGPKPVLDGQRSVRRRQIDMSAHDPAAPAADR
ncbi:hypothetical protein [Pseudonocardia sp. DLS-67]